MARILGTRGVGGGLQTGTAYIYIPTDVNRDKFISDCFNTSTVSILTSDSHRFDKVYVSRNIFQELDFPESIDDLGSLIFYVKLQKHNQPIIVGVINKKGEVLGYQNGQFKLEKISGSNIVSILGDAKKGNLFVNVSSDIEGNIIVNVKNKDKKSKVKLNVDGDINTVSTNSTIQVLEEFKVIVKNGLEDKETETSIKYTRDKGFTYSDQYKNEITISKEGLVYKNEKGTFEVDKDGKFSFKNDKTSLTDLLTTLIQTLEQVKVSTSIGLQPFVNLADFTKLRTSELPKILK